MKKRVAIYNCTMSQEVNDLQVALLTELVESTPDEVIFSASKDVYSDVGVSKAQVEGRPALEEVLERTKNGEYDFIVIKSYKNLTRNTDILFVLINELAKYEVGFMFVEEDVITLDEMDCFKLGFISRGEEKSSKKSGDAVIGFNKVETEQGVKYELNIEEVPVVAKIFGSFLEHASLEEIKFGLEFEGLLNVRGEEEWSIDMIKDILRNPIYKGLPEIGTVDMAIINPEVWDFIQQVLS